MPETEAPASAPSAAPAGGAASSSEHTAAAAASPSPQVTVSTGAPGTSSQGAGATAAGATSSPKWFDAFDADTKEYVTQKGFADPKAVVESYRNLEKLRGVPADRLLKLPDAPDAPEWNDVYSKLGKPATPEGYGLQPTDPNKPGFTKWATETFHKLNLTSAQGQELAKQFNEFSQAQEQEALEQHTAKVQEQTAALKKEWGAAYNQNLARAQAAYRQFGIPDKAIDTLEREIGFDGVMKLMNSLGSKVGEHGFISGDGSGQFQDTVLTPEQANARIRALKQDPDFSSRYIKGEVKAREEMDRLMRMANPPQ